MTTDEKPPVAKKKARKATKKEAPMTQEQFTAEMHELTERARAAGLSPVKAMAQNYVRQGASVLESFLASMENANTPKKK